MILAAHLPSYFPSIDFLAKLDKADVLVLADNLQYPKHGMLNRCRIKTSNGVEWLTVPVLTKGRGRQSIRDVGINTTQEWPRKHWRTIQVNYKYAAYFEEHEDYLADVFSKRWSKLVHLNLHLIEYIARYLDITARIELASELRIQDLEQEWVLAALRKTGCTRYLVENHYRPYLSEALFRGEGLELTFFETIHSDYHQQFEGFAPGLSCLDLLLNEGRNSHQFVRSAKN